MQAVPEGQPLCRQRHARRLRHPNVCRLHAIQDNPLLRAPVFAAQPSVAFFAFHKEAIQELYLRGRDMTPVMWPQCILSQRGCKYRPSCSLKSVEELVALPVSAGGMHSLVAHEHDASHVEQYSATVAWCSGAAAEQDWVCVARLGVELDIRQEKVDSVKDFAATLPDAVEAQPARGHLALITARCAGRSLCLLPEMALHAPLPWDCLQTQPV